MDKLGEQLDRYVKLTNHPAEKFFYAVPDVATRDRLLKALRDKQPDSLKAFERKFRKEIDVQHFLIIGN